MRRDYFIEQILDENKEMKRKIELYESEEVIGEMKRRCDQRVRAALEKVEKEHEGWMNCVAANKELKSRNTKLYNENTTLKKTNDRLERRSVQLSKDYERMEDQLREETFSKMDMEDEMKELRKTLTEKDGIISALQEKILEQERMIDRMKAQKGHDGSMGGIPTSQTPIDQQKRIPNGREKSGRNRGGQPGRKKTSMEGFHEEEITEVVAHEADVCPECGASIESLEEEIVKDEADYEIKIIKKRHVFPVYRCKNCGKVFHVKIPMELKEENQYGPEIQTMILALLDLGFISVCRAKEIITGMVKGEFHPSDGFIGKIQKRATRKLKGFCEEVRLWCLRQKILYWDDTVVFMDTRRACFRFYGNEKAAYYVAHQKKDLEGILSDGILDRLGEDTYLMHDHVKVNYRKEFLFQNIECIQHLKRDLAKTAYDTDHAWAGKMERLIGTMIHKRKEYIKQGKTSFTDEDTTGFEIKYERLLMEGKQELEEEKWTYDDERKLLKRLTEYRENYFAWVYNFDLPTTNNLSERSLRMTKTKLKVSGQFQKEETASEFAAVRTYTETCKRN